MRWLKHIVSIGLLVAAAGVALATGLSDHSDDYGKVPLPGGGTVQLPKGGVIVFISQVGDGNDPIRQIDAPYTFEVTPIGGGPPVPFKSAGGATEATAVTRSETIGELGAVAKFDVPVAGAYTVKGSGDLPVGLASLEFGTNAGTAIANKWRLLAGLVGAAMLVALIPVPRGRRYWGDEDEAPRGWSSDSRQPYAG